MSFVLIPGTVRRAGYERFFDKYIHGVYAGICGMCFETVTQFSPFVPGKKMKYAAAENDVILSIWAINEHVGFEKMHIDAVVFCKFFSFFNSLFGNIESSHFITAFGKEDCVFC